MANEVFEITNQGEFKPSLAQWMTEPDSKDDIRVVEEHDSQLVKERHEDPEAQVSGSKSSCDHPALPPEPCLGNTMSDRAVYMCYIRAMGFANALIFLALGFIFASCFMLPSQSRLRHGAEGNVIERTNGR